MIRLFTNSFAEELRRAQISDEESLLSISSKVL